MLGSAGTLALAFCILFGGYISAVGALLKSDTQISFSVVYVLLSVACLGLNLYEKNVT